MINSSSGPVYSDCSDSDYSVSSDSSTFSVSILTLFSGEVVSALPQEAKARSMQKIREIVMHFFI